MALKGIFQKLFSRERRRAERFAGEGLAAFFWTGAAPKEHDIRDISSTGLFLVTEERWYPGTLVKMTLQKKNEGADDAGRSIAVQSRTVRWGEDGVGLEFVLADGQRNSPDGQIDRRILDKFLRDFQAGKGKAVVTGVEPAVRIEIKPNLA